MNADEVIRGLSELIDRRSPEQEVQRYIELHPWLVTDTHYVDQQLLISKLPLGADYCTDFAFFYAVSGGSYLQLVEIESPCLQVFTQDDEFTAEFNKAVQQLADWEEWCARNQPAVERLLEPLFEQGLVTGVPRYCRAVTMLIAGRRADVLSNPRRRTRWEHRANEQFGPRTIRTWDGFLESLPLDHYRSRSDRNCVRCVRYKEQGYWQCLPSDDQCIGGS